MPSTPEVIGKYKIERFLASGGMGDIYLARDPMLDRPLAIKLLREGFDSDELRERFEREARAAGRLSHPNIVTIYEFGLFEERPFIAMEYVPGESLAALIRRREALSLSRKLELIEGLCAGLAHAHRANIVHRDIKPANLIVDPEGGLKVLDFGIVKLAGSGLTHHGVLVGTVNYMSPEQIAGAPDGVDHRSDVFAVGAVFYELLAYQRAFPGQMAEVLYKIVHNSPDPISRLCPGLDSAIERAVNKCLDRSADRRYQDLTQLRREVARIRQRIDLENTPDLSTTSGETLVIHTPSQGGSAGVQPLTPDRVSGLLASAQVALDERDVDRAVALCEQAAAIAPADTRVRDLQRAAVSARETLRVQALLGEAEGHLDAQRLVEARVAIDLVIATRPDSATALALRDRLEGLIADEEWRRDRTRRLAGAINRARADLDRGALNESLAAVDEALALDPENATAMTLRQRIEDALTLEQERVRQAELARAEQRGRWLAAADEALAQDDLDAAGRALDEVEALGGDDEASMRRAHLDERQRALQRAADCARQAQVLFDRGDLNEAAARADEALAIVADHTDALPLRARITLAIDEKRARDERLAAMVEAARDALQAGDHETALSSLEEVRQTEPSWPGLSELGAEASAQRAAAIERARLEDEIQRTLAAVDELLARQDLDAAKARLTALQTLEHGTARVQDVAGRVDTAIEARRAEDARRRAEEERARLLEQIARGRAAMAAGRVDEAVALLRPLKTTASAEAGFAELLAQVEQAHAQLEAERRRERERAQRIAAALERANRQLADGGFAAAHASVDEALEVAPAHPPALAMRQRITAALEQRVDELIRAAAPHVAKERHERAINLLTEPGITHPRLAAEIDRLRQAGEALVLERRVDDALSAARGRFRRKSPEAVLAALEQSGLQQHPRIEREMREARQTIADAAERTAQAAREAQAQQALQAQARASREQEEKARADKARAEKLRADQARADQAVADMAAKEAAKARERAASLLKASTDQTRVHKAAGSTARPEPATAPAPTPQWRAPVALGAAVVTVLALGYLAARQFWPAPASVAPTSITQTATPGTAPGPIPDQPSVAREDPPAPAPESSPVTVPPTSPATVEPKATELPSAPSTSPAELARRAATRIEQLFAAGRREQALAAASDASASYPDDPSVTGVIEKLLASARQDARAAQTGAIRSRAPEQDATGYDRANASLRAADRAPRGRPIEAARAYWSAAVLFGESSARAAAAPPPVQQTPAQQTPAQQGTQAQRAEPQRETPPRETEAPPARQTPSQQPTTQVPATPPVVQQQPPAREPERQSAAFDAVAVQGALNAYADAYASLSVDAVVRAYPNLPPDQRTTLTTAFDRASRYQLTLGRCQIAPQSPTQAVATCSGGRRSIRFKEGRTFDSGYSGNFTLERRGAAWVIVGVK